MDSQKKPCNKKLKKQFSEKKSRKNFSQKITKNDADYESKLIPLTEEVNKCVKEFQKLSLNDTQPSQKTIRKKAKNVKGPSHESKSKKQVPNLHETSNDDDNNSSSLNSSKIREMDGEMNNVKNNNPVDNGFNDSQNLSELVELPMEQQPSQKENVTLVQNYFEVNNQVTYYQGMNFGMQPHREVIIYKSVRYCKSDRNDQMNFCGTVFKNGMIKNDGQSVLGNNHVLVNQNGQTFKYGSNRLPLLNQATTHHNMEPKNLMNEEQSDDWQTSFYNRICRQVFECLGISDALNDLKLTESNTKKD